ncbi:hypothetical protein LZ012_11570 [Dechloromonas sp. XY25]|uniref:NlpC/P60 domain-containing protein n=1 Tax=Dechloromonas hankyongensis TaxID=2908002 RepID=A0ABS9K3A8_9RHOO|nr:hypothetical protein [Dechloromonas hankyongensis]MCG2577631.1 hypothetical protein [Dechloromonas hankyongensis]
MIILPGQGKSIPLATSKGNPIENEQNDAVTAEDEHWDGKFAARHLSAKPRGSMSGRYNCHGLVFASRRTRIFSYTELTKILSDDNYIEIAMSQVLEGDIILYYENNEVVHSGIVVNPPCAANLWNPMVFSKWGSGREFVHRGNDCPYTFNVKYIRLA